MFKDKREGWLKDLKEGQNVTLAKDDELMSGKVKKVTPLGVFLIELETGLKVKIEPTGKDLSGRMSIVQRRG